MKYFTSILLLLTSTFSTHACICQHFDSFCDVLDKTEQYYLNDNISQIVCYVKYTGNFVPFGPGENPELGRYEVKVIDLLYGEIQAASEGFHNSDSTFWVMSGFDSCSDIFNLENNNYAIMAPYKYSGWDYNFDECANDLQVYTNPIEPLEYVTIVQNVETCWNRHCENDLTLTVVHDFLPTIYQGVTITSASIVDDTYITYKAIERVTLQNGFKAKGNSHFRAEVNTICN